jgi:hypothetical protein
MHVADLVFVYDDNLRTGAVGGAFAGFGALGAHISFTPEARHRGRAAFGLDVEVGYMASTDPTMDHDRRVRWWREEERHVDELPLATLEMGRLNLDALTVMFGLSAKF